MFVITQVSRHGLSLSRENAHVCCVYSSQYCIVYVNCHVTCRSTGPRHRTILLVLTVLSPALTTQTANRLPTVGPAPGPHSPHTHTGRRSDLASDLAGVLVSPTATAVIDIVVVGWGWTHASSGRAALRGVRCGTGHCMFPLMPQSPPALGAPGTWLAQLRSAPVHQ